MSQCYSRKTSSTVTSWFIGVALATAPMLAAAQQAAGSGASERALEEIVVTANRREERLQDVGISVTALGVDVAHQPEHHDGDRHHPRRAQSQDERVFVLPGGLQHPRRGAEQLRRRAGAAGRRLPGRQLLELDQPRELPGVRPRARRGAARPAGHAVRPQRDGRRDPVHLEQADQGVRGIRHGDFRPLQPADLRGRGVRARSRTNCRDASPSSATRTTATSSELFPGQEDRGANDHYALRGQIAWQPTEDTDVNLILRYLRADKERQAGLYSHEPACPE